MKSMRPVLVLAGLGLIGMLAMGSGDGGRAIGAVGARKDRLVADRKARGTGNRPRRQALSEDLQGGADASTRW